MSRGIDYSGPGSTANRDLDTGIRYGIISLHKLGDDSLNAFDTQYDACCPHCGEELPEDFHFTREAAPIVDGKRKDGWWQKCTSCEKPFREDEQYGDEPSRTVVDDGTYSLSLDSSNDVWVFKSPYYTRAAFCSPCAPGACYLTSPCDDGERAYCLGPEWFDGEPPYPIYSVETNEEVPSCGNPDCPKLLDGDAEHVDGACFKEDSNG